MNRPPKKHKSKKDGILNDPRYDRRELEEADRRLHQKDAPEGDDRNLVHVDDAFKEADMEDQVWLFWQKNKSKIYLLIAVLFLGVIGVEGYRIYQRSAIQSMQSEYSKADTPEAMTEFGQQYAGQPLAGVALLKSADEQYEAENFTAAAALYKSAAASLKDTYVLGRARLGEAMSELQAGNTELGKNLLTQLSTNNKAIAAIRAEATFNLGILALSTQDYRAARRQFEQTVALDAQGAWGTQANRLMAQTPELAEATPATAPAPAAVNESAQDNTTDATTTPDDDTTDSATAEVDAE